MKQFINVCFLISVIIPYYNARNFIVQSIESCVSHEIVSEVLVVYDGCPELNFFELREMFSDYSKVTVLAHPDFENLGAGASRNLGIVNSKYPFIAFLDSDDYFLRNRFEVFLNFIANNVSFDGIYEAGVFEDTNDLYTISNNNINSKNLLHFLIRGTYGHFCTNCIIISRKVLEKSGVFNENLILHQDSELWIRLSFYGQLMPGNLSYPVSVIRRHKNNRIWKGTTNSSRLKQWRVTWKWARHEPIGIINKLLIIRKLIKFELKSLYK
ncbi:glycosyltransferase family 2 protein [Algoriphagus chordae]|uniref:glycosyltransferase family 2 protein n=1 Tax=Algoriphagus chordae TaxID=237019 RepID=UPI001313F1A7|nr:glycosyltransferase family 2 protein [Algoriphagus chordae]